MKNRKQKIENSITLVVKYLGTIIKNEQTKIEKFCQFCDSKPITSAYSKPNYSRCFIRVYVGL